MPKLPPRAYYSHDGGEYNAKFAEIVEKKLELVLENLLLAG